MNWSLYSINRLFDDFAQDWCRLNDELMSSHPLFDLPFIKAVVEHFKEGPLWLGVLKDSDQVNGIAILKQNGLGRWETFQPSQLPLGLIIVKDNQCDQQDCISGIFKALPGLGMQLGLTHIDPDFGQVPELLDTRLTETITYGTTMRISVNNNFDSYWSVRPKKLQQNLARYLRRVERENIVPRLEITTESQAISQAVADYGNMESMGWKGKKGSAVHKDNIQGRFYNSVMQTLAQTDQARAYRLYFNEQCVAMRLAIEKNGRLIFLKTTYDEEMSRYAPGGILLYMVIKEFFDNKSIKVAEFYTKASRDQLQWSSETRDIYHINYYRSPFWKWLVHTVKRFR